MYRPRGGRKAGGRALREKTSKKKKKVKKGGTRHSKKKGYGGRVPGGGQGVFLRLKKVDGVG